MSYTIQHNNVLDWARAYDGEPFHAMLCDPPYHLTDIGRSLQSVSRSREKRSGFMGRSWDGGDVAYRPETWAALAQHLYPGAFGMAFASTRGLHRMMVAIEDAGLILQPTIFLWGFGCLSEDTEILTINGWEPYHKAIAGTDVLCYNTAVESLEWNAVQELYTYAYDDTAYHIRSDHTDQIVSRNHRCLVERDGKFVFRFAETLQREEVVPVLASVPDMREPVQRGKQRPIPQGQVLLEGVRAQGIQHKCIREASAIWPARKDAHRAAQGRNDYLPGMRYGKLEARRMAAQGQNTVLLPLLQGESECAPPRAVCRQRQGQEKSQEGKPWCAQSSVEGWRNLLQDTRELYRREVCPLPDRIYQHGPQGWLRDGASTFCCPCHWPAVTALRSGTPQGSQSSQQRSVQSTIVREQPRSQTVRASRIAQPDLATVTPVHYRGLVWCVRVPTGAFVARRNGKIFITGNSGFPKATRIDTQIDRMAGAERKRKRPVACPSRNGNGTLALGGGWQDDPWETAPATELARAWEGHRYGGQALKPAVEPIIVFQKPYEGRPVECITRTGAGALNIDQARIGLRPGDQKGEFGPHKPEHLGKETTTGVYGGSFSRTDADNSVGRWPANLILQHTDRCERIGTRRVRGYTSGDSTTSIGGNNTYNGGSVRSKTDKPIYADETIDDWRCVPECPVARLGAQSGERETGGYPAEGNQRSQNAVYGKPNETGPALFGSSTGTAARYFFQADYALERLADADPLYYCAKASRAEREAGLDPRTVAFMRAIEGDGDDFDEVTVDDGRYELVVIEFAGKDENGKWVSADQEVVLRVDTAMSPPRVIGASMMQPLDASAWNMLLFGNESEEPSRLASKSITLTKINSITESRTLSWLMRSFTNAYTAGVNSEQMVGGSRAESADSFTPSMSFILAEAVSVPGAVHAASGTRWTISAGESREFIPTTINDGRRTPIDNPYQRGKTVRRNGHPCVKPLSLARYLATLLLPPDRYAPRRLLVPFAGVASEMIGAMLAGWEEVLGIELDDDGTHIPVAEARIAYWLQRRAELSDPSKPITVKIAAAPDGQLDMFEGG